MHRQGGFTLIELMIAVTVVATLASLALPIYQRYVTRAKVTEGFSLAGGAKVAVTNFYTVMGGLPDNNQEAALAPPAEITSRYVESIEVLADGVIQITFQEPSIDGETITLTPTPSNNVLLWSCASSLPEWYMPGGCE